ncbi:hypothetical protein [Stenotrophomonas sp.]|uniref:type IV pilus modification PilV family protein n=1 Tax=Stenotrophomonas sp. TaxID=69392 RepID=UPI002D317493|nr:hypothetical protein [Stenotrophomonas sp.]HYQ24373.1 hypothetical protein [Stenotrophomonas sp.]
MSTCSDHRPRRRSERGEVLLEALIGVLLTSIIAAGLAHVQARLMQDQRTTKVERLVVGQLRNQLQTSGIGLCASASLQLPLSDTLSRTATVSCGGEPRLSVGVAGAMLDIDAPAQVDLTVKAQDLELDGGQADESAVDLRLSSRQ